MESGRWLGNNLNNRTVFKLFFGLLFRWGLLDSEVGGLEGGAYYVVAAADEDKVVGRGVGKGCCEGGEGSGDDFGKWR